MTGKRKIRRLLITFTLLCLSFDEVRLLGQIPETPEAVSTSPWNFDFHKDIQPIFEQNCYECHGPNMQMSGFRLDLKESAFAGGSLGKESCLAKPLKALCTDALPELAS